MTGKQTGSRENVFLVKYGRNYQMCQVALGLHMAIEKASLVLLNQHINYVIYPKYSVTLIPYRLKI